MCKWRSSRRASRLQSCLQFALLLAAASTGAVTSAATNTSDSPSPDTRSREQIFRDVFGRPAPDVPISAYVLVRIDGAAPEKLPAVLGAEQRTLRIEGNGLIALLARRIRTESVDVLRRSVDPQGWLPSSALEAAGIVADFDARRFTLSLTTDPRIRTRRVEYLSGAAPSAANALRPAAVSGFVNLNGKATQRDYLSGERARGGSDFTLAADGAVRAGNIVLESSGYAHTGDHRGFIRGDTRLVHDRPEDALRYSVGDLRYPVVGYQTVVDVGGMGVSRDFSLQPYLRNYRASQFEFYLERPAEVRIWVNDSLVNTLQLPAGLHDIRGLSPAVGLNTTRLVIQDISGRLQTLEFSFIYSPLLLEEGTNAYSINAGLRRRLVDNRYQYDPSEPVLSASYLEGFSKTLTWGGYMQADAERAVVGALATRALAESTIQVDAAVRSTRGQSSGAGVKLDWTYFGRPQASPAVQGQLRLEYLGAHFGTVNEFTTPSHSRMNVYGALSVPLDAADSVQLVAYYTPARHDFQRDAYNLSAAWTRRSGAFTFSLGVRDRRAATDERDRGVFFGLTYSFSQGDQNFYFAKERETDAVNASWSTSRSSMQASPYAFANARADRGVREYGAGAGYWNHQGLVEASHQRGRIEQDGTKTTREETAVRMQTALVFADGVFGVTSAVAENFAVVRGKEGLSGVDMKLDGDSEGGARGRSSWISPAVLGSLASYQVRQIRVEPVDPPVGATPEKLVYALAPAYKSGILLELGKEARIIAVGRLLDAKRQGLVNVPLEVRPIGSPQAEPIRTFTSRTGAFQVPDLRPGRYEISPSGPRAINTVIVDVPKAPDGVYRLGDIVVGQ